MNKVNKLYNSEVVKSTTNSDGKELFWFLVTSEKIDRQNEVVKSDAYNIDKFMLNPVMFFQHNSQELPIGKWLEYEKTDNGLLLGGWFHEIPNEEGDNLSATIKEYVKQGIINSTSIGFRALKSHTDRIDNKNILVYDEIELIEVSIVTIGANPEALQILKNFNIGTETMDLETKAGSVLSKSNKDLLIGAMEAIKTVIESAGKEPPSEEITMNYEKSIKELTEKINSIETLNTTLIEKINSIEDGLKPKTKKIKFSEITQG